MSKTRTGSGPVRPARGNFTPPGRDQEAAEAAVPAGRAPGRWSPRSWRVRTRLIAIALVPVIVALVVGGFNVDSSVQRWRQADDAVRTAQLVRAATSYGNALMEERDLTAVPLLAGDPHSAQVGTARAATDAAARTFDAAAARMPDSADLRRRLAGFRKAEAGLPALRKAAYTAALPGVRTEEAYTAIQHPLSEFANELGFGTDNLTGYGRTLYAMSLTKGAESLTRSIGTAVLVERNVPSSVRTSQLTALASYAYLENIALEEFSGGGTPQDMALLTRANQDAANRGDAEQNAARAAARAAGKTYVTPPGRVAMLQAIAAGLPDSTLKAHGITADSWMASSTLAFGAYHSVEDQLAGRAERDAASIAAGARRDAVTDAAVVLLGVLAAFAVASWMARSMSNGMRELRGAALEVAHRRLPALVEQLSRPQPGRVDTRVEPIPITSADEIGEVARAFDQVHREAVRLAAEQAMLRGNVNAIFTNLSLRNQGLIQRQLALITDLENNEADPDQLASLFRLDHLATRMRRNGENLLVLAGEEAGRQWNRPVPLVDVLRAAASEVESYERIEISGVPAGEIHGTAVTDLVHLLAELLENATSFSSPHTRVKVTATRLPDGRIVVEIHDMGIGLTAEDFADINHKLAEPPTVDAAVSQRMGLFVVGRLAGRHGIKVQLRPSGEQAGTTSLVMLPEPITHGGDQQEGDFTVSRIVPEHPAGAYESGQLTAEQLGFDDLRYEVPAGAAELHPVGRSLRLEGRRAALEAAAGERRSSGPGPVPFGEHRAVDGRSAQSVEQSFPGAGQGAGYPVDPYGGFTPGQRALESGYDPGYPVHPATTAGPGEMITPVGRPAPETEYVHPGASGGHQDWDPGYPQDPWSVLPQQPPPGPEPLPAAPERVGYDAPDAGPAHREQPWPSAAAARGQDGAPAEQAEQGGQGAADGRSVNNELWQRAGQAREPKAGGVTPSGLPQRVPRANLVAGAAQQTPQSGPLVSRDPRDVGGRLNSLRRGVRQGREAGPDAATDGHSSPTDSQGPGPNHQER
ncbi:nitrate- and nitrite sensing domain-containing protein [Streptomyces sp. SL13]|uniref:histidine kinase n=1 Tax=Streptantibioticus silvisoli TaxID=2705255 RepID=A0AA90H0T5_9ACTN|nr:nitrate- and nitrite sensing domain-containing protein [Streptantibioticus silvisoli]MDI5962823.1 nitrate- and nitrite sensing domain-containing protein [Streptantibioticus silvisoli]MDI5968440.1 nitrate- and nitrite sensing domain-containing protein [Streptantibioticus silvisoli]